MKILQKLKKFLKEVFSPYKCFNCGKELKGGYSIVRPIYCTEKCRREYHQKQDLEEIE